MKTVVYLMRHSKPMRREIGMENTNEDAFTINKKLPLSIEGEKLAESFSNREILSNLDAVWSSSYTRAMATAKYFADKNNMKMNIEEDFGERKQGIKSFDELPADFEIHQFQDENYKIGDGESQNNTRVRMTKAFIKVFNQEKGKTILIVSHATAIMYLLKNWCEISYGGVFRFQNQNFYNGFLDYCTTFKLEFEEDQLTHIETIKL